MKQETEFRYTILGKDFVLHTNDPMAVQKVENDFEVHVQLQTEKTTYTQAFLKSEITIISNNRESFWQKWRRLGLSYFEIARLWLGFRRAKK